MTAILCMMYAAAIVGIWLLLRLAAERWWPATLLMFSPRWVWLAPAAVLIPLALLVWRRWTWLPVLTCGFALFGLVGFSIPWRWPLQPSPNGLSTLRILTANLHGYQANVSVLDRLIATHEPQIITFQDYSPRAEPAIIHQAGWQVCRDYGLLVASRWPVSRVRDIPLNDAPPNDDELRWSTPIYGPPHGVAICYAVETPAAGRIHIVSVHLASPHGALDVFRNDWRAAGRLLSANSARRALESQVLFQFVKQLDGPVILTGDFNTPDDSPLFREIWTADYHDAYLAAGFGFGATYVDHHTWLRIDHLLCSAELRCLSCRTSGDVGSGHRAVIAEISR